MSEDARHRPATGAKDDPNLGQKEAEQEKEELEDEENEDAQDHELEPMTERSDQQQHRGTLGAYVNTRLDFILVARAGQSALFKADIVGTF
jgi:hypothetical protein